MRYPKLFLVGLFFSLITNVFAGHEKGGLVINYESVGHITGNSLDYVLTGYEIYENIGLPPASTKNIDLVSSCFANSTYTIPLQGTYPVSTQSDYCTPALSLSSSNILIVYQDTISLPGQCSDFLFEVIGNSGLYFVTSNINDNYSYNSYFYAELDNTNGPNSTPQMDPAEIIQGVCANKPLNLYGFSESDGDSVVYSPSAPPRILGGVVSDFGFNAGYSISNPVGSSQGYVMNSSNGMVQTELSAAGNYIIPIMYEEYRLDPATSTMEKIGEGRFMALLIGSASCSSAPFELDYEPVANADSVQCGTNTLRIGTSRRMAYSSITASGSEFEVISSSGNFAVTGVQSLNDSLIEIQLSQPIPANADLRVTTQMGSDGNTILSYCGKELSAFMDTLHFYSAAGSPASAAFTHITNKLDVNFTSNALGDSLSWDFGDGSAPVDVSNPNHTYSAAGQYSVSLIAFNECGFSDTIIQTITVCDSLTAGFSYNLSGDTVNLNAWSSANSGSYHWDFGDGNTGTGMINNHHFSGSGSFVITLTAMNACGDSVVVHDTVSLCSPPIPSWTYEIVSTGGSGMVVDFDGTNSQNVDSFLWDFDDGNTNSTSLTPQHTYTTPSLSYRVSLSITNTCGSTEVYAYRLDQVGLREVALVPELKIFPNPVEDELQLEASEEISSVQLFTVDGKKLQQQNFGKEQTEISLSLGDVLPGLYLLEVRLNSGAVALEKIQVR